MSVIPADNLCFFPNLSSDKSRSYDIEENLCPIVFSNQPTTSTSTGTGTGKPGVLNIGQIKGSMEPGRPKPIGG